LATLTTGSYQFIGVNYGIDTVMTVNAGQRPFAYTAPSGFKALCTANLPAPTIVKPSTVMDVKLYTGNGSTQSITGLGFSPDLLWFKNRSGNNGHALFDSVRGRAFGLTSNAAQAEATSAAGNDLASFDSSGFTVGPVENWVSPNFNGASVVAWTWDAGSSTVTNTAGTVSSQVRANATAGFSVVTWTAPAGSTLYSVGHGLGVPPSLIIAKDRDSAGTGWIVYHSSVTTANQYLALSSTSAVATAANIWGSGVTSSVFGNTSGIGIVNSAKAVAYCFAPVVGYSAFGSYTGNGSADGPFVYLGFRPALVLVKMSSSAGNWTILDDKREGYNVDNDPLYPNLSNAEGTTDLIDITSNGFKVRTTDATFNTSSGTYIYAAWASSPFAYSRAR
jgi:hypothetical protein